jgi:riboflavin kinase/FMN adenylyltransferase
MFDGVHRGHKRVLGLMEAVGRQLKLPTVLVTFDPHPCTLLRPDFRLPLLSSLADRMELLAATGTVDYCIVLPFDRRRRGETVDEFVRDTLVDRLGMRSLVVGENFACGKGRRGDIAYLQMLGATLGFTVHPVPLRLYFEPSALAYCSSSETRRLIQLGNISGAAALLERPHEMNGTVVGPSWRIRHVVDLELPEGMCAPPADDYWGTVRRQDKASSWVVASMHVREDRLAKKRIVRLIAREEPGVYSGDTMALRFFDKMLNLKGGGLPRNAPAAAAGAW